MTLSFLDCRIEADHGIFLVLLFTSQQQTGMAGASSDASYFRQALRAIAEAHGM